MNNIPHTVHNLIQHWWARCLTSALALVASPAFAQFEGPTAKLNTVQQALIGVGVTIITCALLWAGYKMAFQHAKWAEVTSIFWGGALAGGAPLFGAWLFS